MFDDRVGMNREVQLHGLSTLQDRAYDSISVSARALSSGIAWCSRYSNIATLERFVLDVKLGGGQGEGAERSVHSVHVGR